MQTGEQQKDEKNNSLNRVQKRLLDMACIVEQILNDHDIPHSISNGTLLGAVRHKGFIPWDDDFDFWIFEERYQEALSYLRDDLPADLFVEDENTEPRFFHAWARVKDLLTESDYSHYAQDGYYAHHGLTVDLFRMVKIPLKDLCARTEDEYVNYIMRRKKLGLIEEDDIVGRFPKIAASTQDFWNRRVKDETPESITRDVYSNVFTSRNYYEIDDFFPLRKYTFEDKIFYGPANAAAILKKCYGDTYLELPPEDKRIPHYSGVEFLDEGRFN